MCIDYVILFKWIENIKYFEAQPANFVLQRLDNRRQDRAALFLFVRYNCFPILTLVSHKLQ